MNDETGELTVSCDEVAVNTQADVASGSWETPVTARVPDYLQKTYWWAYLHPVAVRFWEQEWLVSLILWGHMGRLTDAVIDELNLTEDSDVLQVACVYGSFSHRLADHIATSNSRLHILDVAPIQLTNARRKLASSENVVYHLQDSSRVQFRDNRFEQVVLYFLLHEQPAEVRRRTISEALRVTQPGGSVVVVDYHRPAWWNPRRPLMWPILKTLEPFALDLWHHSVNHWIPPGSWDLQTTLYCGGLYQKTVIRSISS